MKKVVIFILMALTFSVHAEEYKRPILQASDVIEFVLQHKNIKGEDVKVILLKFDYLKKLWHLELSPVGQSCFDCFPSFYIYDSENPKVITLMRG